MLLSFEDEYAAPCILRAMLLYSVSMACARNFSNIRYARVVQVKA